MTDSTFSIIEPLDTEGEPIVLFNCPCGKEEPHIVHNKRDPKGASLYFVSCYCGWRGPMFASMEQAIEAWNKRG